MFGRADRIRILQLATDHSPLATNPKKSGPISGATIQKRLGGRTVREGDSGHRSAGRNGSTGDVENGGGNCGSFCVSGLFSCLAKKHLRSQSICSHRERRGHGQLIVEAALAPASTICFPLNQKSKEKKKCTILHIGCMPLPPRRKLTSQRFEGGGSGNTSRSVGTADTSH